MGPDFIKELEDAWEKKYTYKQTQIYLRKLSRFTGEQLENLLEKLLETSRYRPKLADIWGTARSLGYFNEDEKRARTTGIHEWEPSDCPRCGGDGRLSVFMEIMFRFDREGIRRQDLKRRRIFRASDGLSIQDYKSAQHEREFLFRCNCPAGDAATLPTKWPVWKGSDAYESAGQVKGEEPTPSQIKRVQTLAEIASTRELREQSYNDDELPF
jgi:hypothetical protein